MGLKEGIGCLVGTLSAALVTLIIIVMASVGGLESYTHHGEEVVVPNLVEATIEEAQILAQAEGLSVQVIDSTYSKKVRLGAIVDQNPAAGSHAKQGRQIYVVVNAKSVRQVVLPNLQDLSYRQAEAMLRSLGLEVEDVEYEPSEYKDLVLDVRYGGATIEAGTRLAEGTKVVLVIGFGTGTEEVAVPNILGKTRSQAKAALLSQRLILGAATYDEDYTEEKEGLFVVYSQSPAVGTYLLEGSRVDIRMTTDSTRVQEAVLGSQEEEFF